MKRIGIVLLVSVLTVIAVRGFDVIGTCTITGNSTVCSFPLSVPINTSCPECCNVTCNQYNDTNLTTKIDSFITDMRNITVGLKEDVKTFNITEKYANMYANWKGCSESFQECYNETQRLKPFEEKYRLCDSDLRICQQHRDGCESSLNKCEGEKWQYGFYGLIAGGIAVYMMTKKEEPDRRTVDTRRSDEVTYNKDALEKTVRKIKGGG